MSQASHAEEWEGDVDRIAFVLNPDANPRDLLKLLLVHVAEADETDWHGYAVVPSSRVFRYYCCLFVLSALAHRAISTGATLEQSNKGPVLLRGNHRVHGAMVRFYYERRGPERSKEPPDNYHYVPPALRVGIRNLFSAHRNNGRSQSWIVLPPAAEEGSFIFRTAATFPFTLSPYQPGKLLGINDLSILKPDIRSDLAVQLAERLVREELWRPRTVQVGKGGAAKKPRRRIDIGRYVALYEDFMEDRLQMVGEHSRQWVVDRFNAFRADPSTNSGYFVITGDPGIGKSTVLAKIIKECHCQAYHFNISSLGLATRRHLIESICSQLINSFGLSYTALPPGCDEDGVFLHTLLREALQELPEGRHLLIAVDAVDEVDRWADGNPTCALFLPERLPKDVYFVLTARRIEDIGLHSNQVVRLRLAAETDESKADSRRFVESWLSRDGIWAWQRTVGVSDSELVDLICRKSEGNFMYLRHVLPALESGELSDRGLGELPFGLRAYYRSHWQQLSRKRDESFERHTVPVVCFLAAAREPVSVGQLGRWSAAETRHVHRVLKQWEAFLHKHQGEDGTHLWRIYHKAFRDFLEEEIDPHLTAYHTRIAECAISKLGGAAVLRPPEKPGR